MPTDLKCLLQLEVPLIVLIAKHKLSVEEVRNLAPGAIIELPKGSEEDLGILVNNQGIAMGKAVKVGENFGVRITFVGDIKQRIEAMGNKKAKCDLADGNANSASDGDSENDAEALAEQMLAGQ